MGRLTAVIGNAARKGKFHSFPLFSWCHGIPLFPKIPWLRRRIMLCSENRGCQSIS